LDGGWTEIQTTPREKTKFHFHNENDEQLSECFGLKFIWFVCVLAEETGITALYYLAITEAHRMISN